MKDSFRLGSWHVDTRAGTVTSERGIVRALRGKSMDVLSLLIEAEGQTVSKNNLMQAVWGNHCVTENSLNQSISELRKVLGDNRKNPRYIKTIHGKGYQLCARIDSPITANRFIQSVAASVILVTLTLIAFVTLRGDFVEQKADSASPDGQSYAYFTERNGMSTLYVVNKRRSIPRPIAEINAPDHYALSWSADGAFLVYNATVRDQPYYAINIIRANGDDALFIKFSKDPSRHDSDSVPVDLKSEIATVDHEEWAGDGYRIHRIDVMGATLSVVFTDNQITGFAWSSLAFS